MPSKTYGEIRRAGGASLYWLIKAEPHVMMRLKRIFPRVKTASFGTIAISDSTEVCRDLEWVLERWPMKASEDDLLLLKRRAGEHRALEETIQNVVTGACAPRFPAPVARAPRNYQQIAADLTLATGRLLLTDDIGLGKTMSSLLVLADPESLPALVVTMTSLPEQWSLELQRTWPDLSWHILTKTTPYDLTQFGPNGTMPQVIITSYRKLASWAQHLSGVVKTVILDEAQEVRTGTSTSKGAAAAHLIRKAKYAMGLTASPVYNYGGEIWNILDIISPGVLGTREEFGREWGIDVQGKVKVRDPRALGTYLRDLGIMLGRTRKEVGHELPTEPLRITQHVNADEKVLERMTGDAVEMAKLILSTQGTAQERFRMAGEFDMRMRQATGIAKAPYVAEFVRLLLESEDSVVVWAWHRAVYDLLAERLESFNPVLYTGSETVAKKGRSYEDFIAGRSRVLLMSLRSGAGLDGLQQRSSVGVFAELDWSPQVHTQCIGRLDRQGQENPVTAYFLVSDSGADPIMADVLSLKYSQSEPLIRPDANLLQPTTDTGDKIKKMALRLLEVNGVAAPIPSVEDADVMQLSAFS